MQNQVIKYAKDYLPPAYRIKKTELRFFLQDGFTEVQSTLSMSRNEFLPSQDLVLDGQELTLQEIAINGQRLHESLYAVNDDQLIIPHHLLENEFTLHCASVIYPEKNSSLEGLYRSNGMFCTQCEAEGFRKITYYVDRPDVMSEFTVTLIAEAGKFPVMLSNGNCISDAVNNGYREVVWHDPFKKPCYLFALVAGELECYRDAFITRSGREIALQIFVEQKDLDKCEFAMDSLKRAMRWDEEVYGREYDLDIFMIVAVDDFNMGAMENKGLNIFNTSCVLANIKTTTDDGFERVEGVVAHEYFHNWSGNRVTCRDWFQLSLKEGFTVYRDAEFSSEMNSRDVKRIEDVMFLRTHQFAEDAGPMAHPVRPDSYIEISNFYTVTIYEKGSEVVRMLANLLGREQFRKACDLYFARHDGQAVTCDDFVKAAEDAANIDLQQFRLWYSQAGTPLLKVKDHYDEANQQYVLEIEQSTPNTPGQTHKQPFFIPIKLALINEKGVMPFYFENEKQSIQERLCLLSQQKQQFIFNGVASRPLPSLLRGFSAPVKLEISYSDDQLACLIANDNDGFSRWDACQTLYKKIIVADVNQASTESSVQLLLQSLKALLLDKHLDDAMLALMFELPSELYLMDFFAEGVDPVRLYKCRESLALTIAQGLRNELLQRLDVHVLGGDSVDFAARSARTLNNCLLSYLMLLGEAAITARCFEQYQHACTMSEQIVAFRLLLNSNDERFHGQDFIQGFYEQWKAESLVVNLWLQSIASSVKVGDLACVQSYLTHAAYDALNPNKVRALIGAFAASNYEHFHEYDGSAYRFLAGQVKHYDSINPQLASRLLAPLTRWRLLDKHRAEMMKKTLQELIGQELSKDVYEIVSKSLLPC